MKKLPLQSVWQRLKRYLGMGEADRIFHLDQEMALSLKDLAIHERRTEDEVVRELFFNALENRTPAADTLQRWHTLSLREQQIAALIRLNYTYRQIGLLLGISEETVKSHAKNVLHKLGLKRRSEIYKLLEDWNFSAWEQQILKTLKPEIKPVITPGIKPRRR